MGGGGTQVKKRSWWRSGRDVVGGGGVRPPGYQLCAENRFRLRESRRGSTSCPARADRSAGTGGSGDGPPTRRRPLSSSPTPHAPAPFLQAPSCPFPSAESCKSGAITVPRASEPLPTIAVSGRRPRIRLWVPPARPPEGAQRSLSEPSYSRYPRCAAARADSLPPRVWRRDCGAGS